MYLCKTIKDDWENYLGSGNEINSSLNLEKTELLGEYDSNEELRKAGIYYSDLWNIVESDLYFNQAREEGQGGNTGINHPTRGINISAALKNKSKSESHRLNLSKSLIKNGSRRGSKNGRYKKDLKLLVTYPDGKTELITEGFTVWCKSKGLCPSTMIKVKKGVHRHHKGFKVRDLNNDNT